MNDNSDLNLLKVELAALRKRSQAMSRELDQARSEKFAIADVKRLLGVMSEHVPESPPWMLRPWKSSARTPHIANILWSDVHYSEKVSPETIEGVNKYNCAIARARCRELVETCVNLCRKHVNAPFQACHLTQLGDLLSGWIHDELDRTNERTMPQAVIEVIDLSVWVIEQLAAAFKRVEVLWLVGNHGRMRQKFEHKRAVWENWEWLIGQMVARKFQGCNDVVIRVADSAEEDYVIFGTRYHALHGCQFRGGTGIAGAHTPWMIGDFRRRKRQRSMKKDYDWLVMAHFHQLSHPDGIWANGSVKGYDEFSYDCGFPLQTPQQWLLVSRPDGRIVYPLPVFLS